MHMWCICRMQRNIHPHTHISVSLVMLSPTAKLCWRPHTWPHCHFLPQKPTQTPLHNCKKKQKTTKQTKKQQHRLTHTQTHHPFPAHWLSHDLCCVLFLQNESQYGTVHVLLLLCSLDFPSCSQISDHVQRTNISRDFLQLSDKCIL